MVYVTGDIHGDMARFDRAGRMLKKGDTLLVCGDFGFLWEGGAAELKTLKKLGKKKYNIAFVDGTHENFDLLNAYPVEEWNGGKVHTLGGSLYHLMRGEIYELEGKRWFVCGGGATPDKQLYVDAGKWWETEMPTREELYQAADRLKAVDMRVDYILTHEPAPRMGGVRGGKNLNALDAFFTALAEQVKFERWFFGSLHQDRVITAKACALFRKIIRTDLTGSDK